MKLIRSADSRRKHNKIRAVLVVNDHRLDIDGIGSEEIAANDFTACFDVLVV